MAVYSAMNRLDATRKKIDEGKAGGKGGSAFNLKDRLQQFGADVVGIASDSLWQIIGVDEPRWLSIKWPELPAPTVPNAGGGGQQPDPIRDVMSGLPSFDQSEVMSQLGFSPDGPNWIEDWMKKIPVKLYDSGGVIPHGGMGLNLSGKPEAVLTNAQMETLTTIANHAVLPFRDGEQSDSQKPRMQITNQITVSNDRSQIRRLRESNARLLAQYGGAK